MENMNRREEEDSFMYALCIGGIIFIALMSLPKGTRRNVVDSYLKTSWDKTGGIELQIQKAKDKVLCWGVYPG
jgi:hypothetical protein